MGKKKRKMTGRILFPNPNWPVAHVTTTERHALESHRCWFCRPDPTEPQPKPSEAFAPLQAVFDQAMAQTQSGKGKERHNQRGEPFTDQQIVRFGDWMGSNHGQVFQAVKKAIESTKLDRARARAELLGAIVYLGAAVLVLDRQTVADPFVKPTNSAETPFYDFNRSVLAEQKRALAAFSRNRGTAGPRADLKRANDWGERTKRKRAK